MKKFIFRCIFFFLVVLVFILMIGSLNSKVISSDYMAASIHKHRLADSIKVPKIILSGGSNMAFGIDSKQVEKSFGIPVVNMALHAGLGLKFMLEELKYTARKNDIIIFSPEYFLSEEGSYELKLNTSMYFKPAKAFFSPNYLLEIKGSLDRNRKKFKEFFSVSEPTTEKAPDNIPVYSKDAFNENGDAVGHLNKPAANTLNDRVSLSYRYWEGIDLLNEFADFAEKKGIKIFFLFPPYPMSEYNRNIEAIKKLEWDLQNNMKIQQLNHPSNAVLADSSFFDTIYHLNVNGRKIRTEQLIKEISSNAILTSILPNK